MSVKYKAVFTPIKIGNITIKNRVLLAPMEGTTLIEWMMPVGFRKEVRQFYIERAKDGVGLMIPGMTPVRSLLGGTKWLHEHAEAFEGVKELLDEIHQYGSKVFIQLGLFSGRNFILSKQMSEVMNQKQTEQKTDALPVYPDSHGIYTLLCLERYNQRRPARLPACGKPSADGDGSGSAAGWTV